MKKVLETYQVYYTILFIAFEFIFILKDTHREKAPYIRKILIWTFGSLVHQINSFEEVLKLEQIFQKIKVVTGKTPLFVSGPFCSRHSICLNIGY